MCLVTITIIIFIFITTTILSTTTIIIVPVVIDFIPVILYLCRYSRPRNKEIRWSLVLDWLIFAYSVVRVSCVLVHNYRLKSAGKSADTLKPGAAVLQ